MIWKRPQTPCPLRLGAYDLAGTKLHVLYSVPKSLLRPPPPLHRLCLVKSTPMSEHGYKTADNEGLDAYKLSSYSILFQQLHLLISHKSGRSLVYVSKVVDLSPLGPTRRKFMLLIRIFKTLQQVGK